MSEYSIYINKIWQGKEPVLTFGVSIRCQGLETVTIKRCYLNIDARHNSFGIRFELTKPENLNPSGAFAALMRKHVKKAIIDHIFKDSDSGDLWLTLLVHKKTQTYWYIKLTSQKPPQLLLISPEGECLIRCGMKGTFTKRKTFEGEIPIPPKVKFLDIGGDLIGQFIEHSKELDTHNHREQSPQCEDQENLIPSTQREIAKRLKRKLKTIKRSYEKSLEKTPTAADLNTLEKKAKTLQSFAYLVRPNDIELTLDATYGFSEPFIIEIDPELSIGANIEGYFKQLKKMTKSKKHGEAYLKKLQTEMESLSTDIDSLKSNPVSEVRLDELTKRYKLPKLIRQHAEKPKESRPYMEFEIDSNYRILVGKGAEQNDLLTKSAKGSDYFFHASGITGSHIIVPTTKKQQDGLPNIVLRAAAILAIHYSKRRTDLAGEVYITKKAHVKKKKGMPPGLWRIEKSETIFIRFTQGELQEILKGLLK